MRWIVPHSLAGLLVGLVLATPVVAQDIKLPSTLTWTAYDTGSSGFNIAVAVGKALKDKHGADVRILPAGNDVARLGPLKGNRAQVSAMGIGSYFASEAVFEFAVREWGPQPIRLMLTSTDCNAISLAVAKDTGVKEVKDLKGKRVGIVVGSPALNQNAYAIIAFAGLTRSDVRLVEFSSYGAMWKGMLNNEIDAAVASSISGQVKEVDASPRGIIYPPTPASDKEGWSRIHKIGPYFYPHKVTCGSGGMSAQTPVDLPSYPYPIFMAYGSQPSDLIHAITKAMITTYDDYKDGAPGAAGLALSRQTLSWVLPYHEGAVRALKEAGAWKAEHEAHNQSLLKRQDALAAAWDAFVKNAPEDKAAFTKAWMDARRAALAKIGQEAIFE
ncbi:MAG TPA: TAXI family TRAP transporter solute-binding subunit [Vineibacter sp.]|nr:TAXI family TRAP transporter solute-binding subunit [Vineibacter sp.]